MLQKPVIIPGSPLPQPLHLCHFKTPAGHVLPSASEIQNQWIKPISPQRSEKNNSKKQYSVVPLTHPSQPLHQVNRGEKPSNTDTEKPST